MSSDRELLEMAAKAAGIEIGWFKNECFGHEYPVVGNITKHWNPLTDDGDALRLAVKCKILAGIGECDCCAEAHYEGSDEPIRIRFSAEFSDREEAGPYAATRRAIVRAAAEIGRGLSYDPSKRKEAK